MAKATAVVAAGGRLQWQGDYTRGRHRDGEAGVANHQTRRHLRAFQQHPRASNGPPGAHNGRRRVVAMPLSGEYAPSTSDWAREQADKYAESGGTDGTELNGMPVILLTTVGAKTGKLRKTPLMRVEHDGEYAIVASLGGAPKNPVWYNNVAKNPRVELQDGTVTRDYDAREVSGDEKAVWWERAVAAFPPYADYQKKTDRAIPLFVLTPVS
jgi:F420H(2)-dependent quinone reductase